MDSVNIYEKNADLRSKKQRELGIPGYTLCEEILNSITHGIGIILAIVATILFTKLTIGDYWGIFCLGVYCISIFVLYAISTTYHMLGLCSTKKIFRVLDHCSIFLLIAGTYTPICYFRLGNTGLIILPIMWLVAVVGIILNSIDLKKYSKLSMVCYIAMGWSVAFASKPLTENVNSYQLWALVSGGIVYTLGAILYLIGKKVRYMHSIWHVFVLAGSILHFMMIYSFFD